MELEVCYTNDGNDEDEFETAICIILCSTTTSTLPLTFYNCYYYS